MKTKNTLIKSLLGFAFAGAMIAPLAMVAAETQPERPIVAPGERERPAEQEVVTGQVSAKTATNLVVDGRTVQLASSTGFVKNGRMISSDEVRAGDSVRVRATAAADGNLTAVTVEVLESKE